MTRRPFFKHFIAEIYFDQDSILDYKSVKFKLQKTCDLLNLRVIKKLEKKFSPQGDTYILVLSSSHLALHTWPENNFIHLDLLTCSPVSLKQFKDSLVHWQTKFDCFEIKYD